MKNIKILILVLTTLAIASGTVFAENITIDTEVNSPQQIQSSNDTESTTGEEGMTIEELKPLLLSIAQDFLNNRNQQLVTGSATEYTQIPAMSERMYEYTERVNTALQADKAEYAERDERFSHFTTEVRLIEANISSGRVTAIIEENTDFYFDKVFAGALLTGFIEEREFTFLKEDGAWIIDDVHLVDLKNPLIPMNEVRDEPADPEYIPNTRHSPLGDPEDAPSSADPDDVDQILKNNWIKNGSKL